MFGGDIGDVQSVPEELAWWFWEDGGHIGKLVPRSDGICDSVCLELIVLGVGLLDVTRA